MIRICQGGVCFPQRRTRLAVCPREEYPSKPRDFPARAAGRSIQLKPSGQQQQPRRRSIKTSRGQEPRVRGAKSRHKKAQPMRVGKIRLPGLHSPAKAHQNKRPANPCPWPTISTKAVGDRGTRSDQFLPCSFGCWRPRNNDSPSANAEASSIKIKNSSIWDKFAESDRLLQSTCWFQGRVRRGPNTVARLPDR